MWNQIFNIVIYSLPDDESHLPIVICSEYLAAFWDSTMAAEEQHQGEKKVYVVF